MLDIENPPAPADALTTGISRRDALGLVFGAGISVLLVSCGKEGTGSSTTAAVEAPDAPVTTQPDITPPDELDTASTTEAPVTNIRPELHPGLKESPDPDLRLMGENEERFGRGFNEAMRFTGMPGDPNDAETRAAEFAGVLLEHERQGIGPYVIFEPSGIDLKGIEENTFAAYFQALKDRGVTDASIGTWALLPEPNIPIWGVGDDLGNTDPGSFKDNFVIVGTALKEVFPEAKVSLILDSTAINLSPTPTLCETIR